jgi:hypothetical protein
LAGSDDCCLSDAPASLTYQRFIVDGSVQASGFWADYAAGASAGTLAVALFANISGFLSDALLYLGFDKATGVLVANPRHDAPVWAMGFMFVGQSGASALSSVFMRSRHLWRKAWGELLWCSR